MLSLTRSILLLASLGFLTPSTPPRAAEDLLGMKFNEVREVAPGVFFRFSSISATDQTVAFGGSNHVWIVFEDFVVVIDANFPTGARDVIEAVRKTTDRPIRYVFDTHHHGDHAYGNAVFSEAGASVIAQRNCARLLRVNGPEEFAQAGRGPTGRKDVAESKLKVPNVIFDDKLVLDDGKQRVEFLFFGHAHTAGDAVAYLPKHRILCTGDACVNGAFNFMGHSDSASWVRVLDNLQQLEVKVICPGHGPVAGRKLLDLQKRYFVELRQKVKQGIDAGKSLDDIIKRVEMPWYKEWTGVPPKPDNITHVYNEYMGLVSPWDFSEDLGIFESKSSFTRSTPGWTKPKRIVIPSGLMPSRIIELKMIAPEVEFVPVRSQEEALKAIEGADALLGFCTPEVVAKGKKLRWIQVNSADVEKYLFPELKNSPITLTNTQRLSSHQVADQGMALLLALSRNVRAAQGTGRQQLDSTPTELNGQTMLVVGMGGIGTQVARRAHAFGMRVRGIDTKEMEKPDFVFSLDKPDKLRALLAEADVVVLACPMTEATRGLIGEKELARLKPTAFLINVARGEIVQTDALVKALQQKQIAGAGLDVTDPEPLPSEHPLLKMSNVLITPHQGDQSQHRQERLWRLYRENVRRFVAGEPLLCVVDKQKGY